MSVIWIILITPLFLYPFGLNPAALATVGGFIILLAIYYLVWARTRFKGPRRQGTDAELTEIEREFEQAAGEVGAPPDAGPVAAHPLAGRSLSRPARIQRRTRDR